MPETSGPLRSLYKGRWYRSCSPQTIASQIIPSTKLFDYENEALSNCRFCVSGRFLSHGPANIVRECRKWYRRKTDLLHPRGPVSSWTLEQSAALRDPMPPSLSSFNNTHLQMVEIYLLLNMVLDVSEVEVASKGFGLIWHNMYSESNFLTWRKADRGYIGLGQLHTTAFCSCGTLFWICDFEYEQILFTIVDRCRKL